MPATITIKGVAPYDGVYPLDFEELFTSRELRDIKLLTGIRAGEMTEAIAAGDTDIVVAFAVIAVRRSGKQIDPNALWDAPVASIIFDAEEEAEGEESLPPANENAVSNEGDEPSERSGEISEPPTVPNLVTQLHTGIPVSVTGAASGSATSTG